MSSVSVLTITDCEVSVHCASIFLGKKNSIMKLCSVYVAILVLYFTQKLLLDEDTATVFYHVSSTMDYLFCIFGAILSDSWLGKFRTILYLSIVYALGSSMITIGAIPILNLPARYEIEANM